MPELQGLFQKYGVDYMNSHKLPPHVCKAIRAISACRTAVLGGHMDICDECGHTRQSYNSCRNRHCPKCQALAKERWILAREAELLPVQYFHVVFTLPSELDELVMQNRKIMLNLLFKASAETVRIGMSTASSRSRHQAVSLNISDATLIELPFPTTVLSVYRMEG